MAFIGRFFRIGLGFFELRGEPFFELRGEPTLCGEPCVMEKPGLRCMSWVSCTGEPFFELRGEPFTLALCGEIGNMGTGLPPGKPGLRCTSWVSCTGLITDQPPAPDLGLDLADFK